MTARMLMAVVGMLLVVGGSLQVAEAAQFRRIESRIFDGASYDGATRTLTLRFDSGSTYAFHDVPRQVYDDFLRIVNHGEYFNRHIRKRYRFERLDRYPHTWAARE